MHILVTNDDGIQAPGLIALAQEIRRIAKVTVLAPDRNWSASGHVKTLERPLRVRETLLPDGTSGYMSDGAPSDCVALGILGVLPEKVDMVVSGINPNANMGHDVTYSGTVTAAMEVATWGLPSVAVSVEPTAEASLAPLDYGPAARAGCAVVAQVLQNGLPENTLLNVNVPYLPDEELKGFMITRQGLRIYRDQLVKRDDPRGRPYYWFGGEAPTGVPDEGTDFGALARGYVSVTPIHLDMTAYQVMDALKMWDWSERGIRD